MAVGTRGNEEAVGQVPAHVSASTQSSSREAALRIAILDRDSGFIQVLSKRTERLGHELRVLGGPVPVETVSAMRLNALVVDLAVLGVNAWEWLERLCGASPDLGVIVCTGPSTVAQRVRGLRLGADDWITKPTHPEEALARVEGVVRRRRRASGTQESEPLAAGEVEVRPDRFQAFVRGASLDLTRREFELLQLLAAAEGRVLEREEIYSRLWGYAMVRGDRSVDVFVRKLRHKLEKASPQWRYIHTHFGIGYRFAAEPQIETMAQEPSEPMAQEPSEPMAQEPSEPMAQEPAETVAQEQAAADASDRRPQVSREAERTGPASDLGGDASGEKSELARAQQKRELAGHGL